MNDFHKILTLKLNNLKGSRDNTEQYEYEYSSRRNTKISNSESILNLKFLANPLDSNNIMLKSHLLPYNPIDKIHEEETKYLSNSKDPKLNQRFLLKNYQQAKRLKANSITYQSLSQIVNRIFAIDDNDLHSAKVGIPTSLAVLPGRYYVVGTSFGKALVFLYNQEFVHVLSLTKETNNLGAIISMDISPNEYLVCGHETGIICIWELHKGTLIKTIKDYHKSAVLFVKFWKDTHEYVISSDNEGFVNLITIKKKLFYYSDEKHNLFDKSPTIIHNISILKPKNVKDRSLSKYTIVALASLNTVLIVTLEPVIKTLHTITNQSITNINSNSSLPYVSWGFGALPGEEDNNSPLLAIMWGKTIDLIKIVNIDDESSKFRLVANYVSKDEMIYMAWISQNFLFILNNDKTAKILYSGSFQDKDIVESRLSTSTGSDSIPDPFDEYLKAIVNIQSMENEFIKYDFFNNVGRTSAGAGIDAGKGVNAGVGSIVGYLANVIVVSETSKRAFMLLKENFYIGRLIPWNDYIKNMISKGDWLKAFCLCLNIYEGKNKMFIEIPNSDQQRKKVLKKFIFKMIKNYIMTTNKIADTAIVANKTNQTNLDNYNNIEGDMIIQGDKWDICITMIIDVLLLMGDYKYLFTKIKELLYEKYQQKECFLRNLERFIVTNRIKYIINKSLYRDVIQYFRQCQKYHIVQQFLFNLTDINDIADLGYIITICLENDSLSTSLIYVCTKLNPPDFLTPLINMIEQYKKKNIIYDDDDNKDNLNMDLSSNSTTSTANNNPYNMTTKPQTLTTLHIGLKCLWYINLCVDGIIFPNEYMDDNRWNKNILDLITYIMKPHVIKFFLEVDYYLVFLLFEKIFIEKNKKLVGIVSKAKYKNFEADINIDCIIKDDALTITTNPDLLYQMLTYIYQLCAIDNEDSQELKTLLYYFIANMSYNKLYEFNGNVIKETLYYILQHNRLVPKWDINKTNKYYQSKSTTTTTTIEYDDLRCAYIIHILNCCIQDSLFNRDELKTISDLAHKTPYIEIEALLRKHDHDYIGAFTLFLTQEHNWQKRKIFQWLEDILPDIQVNYVEYYKKFQRFVLGNIKELVEIDSEETYKIVSSFENSMDADAIKMLEDFPKLQLEYLKEMLNNQNDYFQSHKNELYELKLKLMCQVQKKQVLNEIHSYDYSIDYVLRTCEQYQIFNACAYYSEQNGQLDLAIGYYLKKLAKTTTNAIEELEKTGKYSKERKICESVNNGKQLCINHNKYANIESEELWFLLFEGYLSIYNQKIVPKKVYEKFQPLVQTFSRLNESLFDELINHVDLASVLSKLDVKSISSSLKVGELRNSLLSILKKYYYESNILLDAKTLVIDDINQNLMQLMANIKHGIRHDEHNFESSQETNKIYLFQCGHLLLRSGNNCRLCQESTSSLSLSIIDEVNIKELSRKMSIGYRLKNKGQKPSENKDYIEEESCESGMNSEKKIKKAITEPIKKHFAVLKDSNEHDDVGNPYLKLDFQDRKYEGDGKIDLKKYKAIEQMQKLARYDIYKQVELEMDEC